MGGSCGGFDDGHRLYVRLVRGEVQVDEGEIKSKIDGRVGVFAGGPCCGVQFAGSVHGSCLLSVS